MRWNCTIGSDARKVCDHRWRRRAGQPFSRWTESSFCSEVDRYVSCWDSECCKLRRKTVDLSPRPDSIPECKLPAGTLSMRPGHYSVQQLTFVCQSDEAASRTRKFACDSGSGLISRCEWYSRGRCKPNRSVDDRIVDRRRHRLGRLCRTNFRCHLFGWR